MFPRAEQLFSLGVVTHVVVLTATCTDGQLRWLDLGFFAAIGLAGFLGSLISKFTISIFSQCNMRFS